jgi:hypothetical protein
MIKYFYKKIPYEFSGAALFGQTVKVLLRLFSPIQIPGG